MKGGKSVQFNSVQKKRKVLQYPYTFNKSPSKKIGIKKVYIIKFNYYVALKT